MKMTGDLKKLALARTQFLALRALFDAIPKRVESDFAEPHSKVKDVTITQEEDKNLRVQFLDRVVKLLFRYDGTKQRGMIVAEDWSYGVKKPSSLWTMTFNHSGALDVEARDGATFSLHSSADC